jgi:large subunit ribosomal protein L28e|uniref:Ribosomal eL28/Mak16 domain-containing protein n=1 Tax=Octactis speculum TaxID=3111310 RepID=A0A7S2DNV5_9STRA|mmetsp:Transcript_51136/g.69635  ORF Transcript_51136/g.69635 Transcript_51136/m.69635 type:complete len:161 (+) Transcript_51136:66-548(+)|eukprot:CAMPEP_0185745516 /NCGR_PEP_ID=MMETSP1174-20130828/3864_1 /TAXON_ID=35687 /ORGANISM="Dictyocha speculum, Strain CCMP1381" /LENGTH=160 /DNA_ID=CAMNT_0028419563 /DNA_START=59 /DNA_END=541 /DNA_ORIENTATION=+
MATCPDSLTWMLVKNQNCFQQKRNGQTKRSGMIVLSSEPGNLRNINAFKYSGLANSKAIRFDFKEEGEDDDKKIKMSMGLKISKNGKRPNKQYSTIPLNKDFRRVEKCIKAQTVDQAYRADLLDAALARWSALHRYSKVKKGIMKPAYFKPAKGSEEDES